jgi:cytochrome c peroxidase
MANSSVNHVLSNLRKLPWCQDSFEQSFPKQWIRMETVGMALASYQQALRTGNVAFDHWYYSGQQSAISEEAQQGFALFQGKGDVRVATSSTRIGHFSRTSNFTIPGLATIICSRENCRRCN